MKEWETINSMVPIWQRPKSQVTKEEYNDFYKSKFGDWQDPILSIHVAAEGNFELQGPAVCARTGPHELLLHGL